MSNERYNLVFRGDIVLGHNLAEVKLRLAKLFKVNETQLERLFSGRPVVIKKSLPKAEADRYSEALFKAGAQVEMQSLSAAAAPEQKAESASSKPTMAERLAAQDPHGLTQEPSGTLAFAPKPAVQAEPAASEEGWVLAPPGAALLAEKYRPAEPEVDIQPVEAELRPMQGNLVDTDELAHPVPPIGVDLTGISLAEVGVDMLDEADRPLPVAEVDAPEGIDLAPVGADLGEQKAEAPALNFDLSAIQLAER